MSLSALVLAALPLLVSTAPPKKGYQLEPLKEAAPAETAEKVRELLAPEGLRVLDPKGQPFVDLWPRKALPAGEAKQQLGIKFGQIVEGSVVGVIRFHQKSSDFKGNAFPSGTYTLRNGIQPVDGDHQGVSETRDFLLVSPVKADTKPEPMATADAVKLSVQTAGIQHPTVLYLKLLEEEGAKLPRLVEDSDLGLWILDMEIPAAPKEKGPVRAGIVIVGKAAE